MIQLLFTVIFSEMGLIIVLVFKTPLRKLVIMGLDRVKRGRGPIIVKTVAGTVFVVLMSTVYSMMKIHKHGIDEGAVNPTDQVLMAKHLLEATLMGSSLFLALMIDRLHHYIRELRMRRKNMEAVKKQSRSFEGGKLEESKALGGELTTLQTKLQQLEADLEAKTKEGYQIKKRDEKQHLSRLHATDRVLLPKNYRSNLPHRPLVFCFISQWRRSSLVSSPNAVTDGDDSKAAVGLYFPPFYSSVPRYSSHGFHLSSS